MKTNKMFIIATIFFLTFNINSCALDQKAICLPIEVMAIILDFSISFKSEIESVDNPIFFPSREFLFFDLEIDSVNLRRSARIFFNGDLEHLFRLLNINVQRFKDKFGNDSGNWQVTPEVSVKKIEKALKKDRLCRLMNIGFGDKRLKVFNIKP